MEPKQLEISNLNETRRLLISNGAFKNLRLENDKVAERNIALLSGQTEKKITECILFSNKLTETVLGEIKRSDAKLANGSTIEDMKLIESMILSSKADKTDVKTEDSGLTPTQPDAISPPPASVSTNPSSRSRCFCLESTEEYGFLVMPDFLILSVSFLFLAYGCSAPVVYLVPYSLSVGVDHKHAAFLMSIFGVSGIVGNITFGWVTDRKYVPSVFVCLWLILIVILIRISFAPGVWRSIGCWASWWRSAWRASAACSPPSCAPSGSSSRLPRSTDTSTERTWRSSRWWPLTSWAPPISPPAWVWSTSCTLSLTWSARR